MPADPAEFRITLERIMCYGTCPIYSLKIAGDGTVIYEGKEFVKFKGVQRSSISSEEVAELLDSFNKAGFLRLKDRYDAPDILDLPSAVTTLNIRGQIKSVFHHHGDRSAPKALRDLEEKIDRIANSQQWIVERASD